MRKFNKVTLKKYLFFLWIVQGRNLCIDFTPVPLVYLHISSYYKYSRILELSLECIGRKGDDFDSLLIVKCPFISSYVKLYAQDVDSDNIWDSPSTIGSLDSCYLEYNLRNLIVNQLNTEEDYFEVTKAPKVKNLLLKIGVPFEEYPDYYRISKEAYSKLTDYE